MGALYDGGWPSSVMTKDELELHNIRQENKFCRDKALIGLWKIFISRESLVFIIITIMLYMKLTNGDNNVTIWIVYCIVGICYIFAESLKYLIKHKTEVKVDLKGSLTAGLNKEIK